MIVTQQTQLAQHMDVPAHAADQLTQPRHQPSKTKTPRGGRGQPRASRTKARKPRPKKKQQHQRIEDSESEEEGDASESGDDGIQPARGPKTLATVAEQSREERKGEDEDSEVKAKVMECLKEQQKLSMKLSEARTAFKNIEEFETNCLRPLNSPSQSLGLEFFAY